MSKKCPSCNITIDDRCTTCPACGAQQPDRLRQPQAAPPPKAEPKGDSGRKAAAPKAKAAAQEAEQGVKLPSFTPLVFFCANLVLVAPAMIQGGADLLGLLAAAVILLAALFLSLRKLEAGAPTVQCLFPLLLADLLALFAAGWQVTLLTIEYALEWAGIALGNGLLVVALFLFALGSFLLHQFRQLPRFFRWVLLVIVSSALLYASLYASAGRFISPEALPDFILFWVLLVLSFLWYLTGSLHGVLTGGQKRPVLWDGLFLLFALAICQLWIQSATYGYFSWVQAAVSLFTSPNLFQFAGLVGVCAAGGLILRRDERTWRGDLVALLAIAELAVTHALGTLAGGDRVWQICTTAAFLMVGTVNYFILTYAWKGRSFLPFPPLVSSLVSAGLAWVLMLLLGSGLWLCALVLSLGAALFLFFYSKGKFTFQAPPVLLFVTLLGLAYLCHRAFYPRPLMAVTLAFLFALLPAVFSNRPRADGSRPQPLWVLIAFCGVHALLTLLFCLLA